MYSKDIITEKAKAEQLLFKFKRISCLWGELKCYSQYVNDLFMSIWIVHETFLKVYQYFLDFLQ